MDGRARVLMRGTELSQTGMPIEMRNVETSMKWRRQNRAEEARHQKGARGMKWEEPCRMRHRIAREGAVRGFL